MKKVDSIEEAFPFKDSNGKPLFRAGQREVITKVKEAFDSGKKFALIDGKTGCGKSVINYTILKSTKGRSVYLTPQKMLQDQIGSESWDDISVLKGGSGYACNYCQEAGSIKYKCNYEGDEVEMCNNTSRSSSFKQDITKVGVSIGKMHKALDGNPYLKYKSSFKSQEDFSSRLREIREYFYNEYDEQTRLDDDDPKKIAKYKGMLNDADEDIVKAFVEKNVYNSVGCTLGHHECPKRSANMITLLTKINVLNPDVMFYKNKFNMNSPFRKFDTLVIDEAHGFEGVIQRIFSSELPVDVLRHVYGINLMKIAECPDPAKSVEMYKERYATDLLKALNTLDVIAKCRGAMVCKSNLTRRVLGNGSKLINDYYMSYQQEIDRSESDPLANTIALIDNPAPDTSIWGAIVSGVCEDVSCKNDAGFGDITPILNRVGGLVTANRKRLSDTKLDTMNIGSTHMREISRNGGVPKSLLVFDLLMDLRSMISDFVTKTSYLINAPDGMVPFLFQNTLDYASIKMTKHLNSTHLYTAPKTNVLSTVIINTGALIKQHFYAYADNVVLSTGTWVYPESMHKALGINMKDAYFHEIPTSFDRSRRPIFMVRDSNRLIDFSAKNDYGEYIYETPQGIARFTESVVNMVDSIQAGLRGTTGEDVNVLVHTNSFKISKLLAENAKIGKNRFRFHAPGNVPFYTNIHCGNIPAYGKEEFLSMAQNSPNSGHVYVSPSITEGVDFKNQLARAQIILKHPMSNWGDPRIQALMGRTGLEGIVRDNDVYDRLTYTTLLQQYGRVMRSEEDWGITVIMDQKCVNAIGSLISNPREVRRAHIKYMLDGVRFSYNERRQMVLDKPKFPLMY